MKRIAMQAVSDLVSGLDLDANEPAPWGLIDRIEKRFNVQGCAEHLIRYRQNARSEYIKAWIEKHTTWESRLWLK